MASHSARAPRWPPFEDRLAERYIARSEGGTFTVVENLGRIDPKEREVTTA